MKGIKPAGFEPNVLQMTSVLTPDNKYIPKGGEILTLKGITFLF